MPRKPYAGTQIGPDGKRHPIGEAPQVPVTAEEVPAGAESKVESTEPASPPSGVTDSAPTKSAPAKKTPPKKKKVGVKIPDAPTGADLMSDPGPGGDIFSSEEKEEEKEEKEAESIKGSNSDLTDSSIEDVRAELEAARAADGDDGDDGGDD